MKRPKISKIKNQKNYFTERRELKKTRKKEKEESINKDDNCYVKDIKGGEKKYSE